MGLGVIFTCNKCGEIYALTKYIEFYRDKDNELKNYGHPCPVDKVAEQAGIIGLYGTYYCEDCKKVVNVVELELDEPIIYDFMHQLSTGNLKQYEKESVCPKCNGTNLTQNIKDMSCFEENCDGRYKEFQMFIS
jgi:hypothetical protein